ncbi:MAG: MotA/TolQ/ExbB proton channel family protein [Bacteroidota bacterium]
MLGILLQITQPGSVAQDTVANAINQPQVTAPKVEAMSLLDVISKGGIIMIPILLLSIIAIYIFISRYITIRKAGKDESSFMNNIRDLIHEGRVDSALSVCRNTQKPIARMIEKGLMRLGRPLKEIGESVEIVGKFEVYKLEKNLVILAVVAGIAPMFGFIGTILGVIKIFYDISLAGDVSISSVSAGLYTKMVSSAGGLIVGIIAFVFYHWLNIMVDKAVHKMEYNAMEFIDLLQEPSK